MLVQFLNALVHFKMSAEMRSTAQETETRAHAQRDLRSPSKTHTLTHHLHAAGLDAAKMTAGIQDDLL